MPVRCPSVTRLPSGKTADSVPPLKRLAVKLAIARIKNIPSAVIFPGSRLRAHSVRGGTLCAVLCRNAP
ncbi:hypothetical protein NEILACOT_05317 [Neisseria lactamica ATCC 23970]|uniref:Uncharacterized protein n=1 Tax=Neisseria lactamica ATCC 23970 TaxID=546265 RepID=D0WCN5_NEILA|nr:hypothetical protein NEILACOT_05317 [Neisseria lactamica ATCC 23970]